MKSFVHTLLPTTLLLLTLASLAYGLNYMYFSDTEITRFNDRIKFWHGDTLDGPVRTNEMFSIMNDPQFQDYFISTAPDYWHGSGANPTFAAGRTIFNGPRLPLPTTATWLRAQALAAENFFSGGDSLWARVVLGDHNLRVWWIPRGLLLVDSSQFVDYPLADSAAVFFDCAEITLSGTLSSVLLLGARGQIGLEDNVLYASADPLTGIAPAGHSEKLLVISEGEIKVLNTVANGRGNSSGLGLTQTDPAYSGIVLDGIYAALGESFTFAQQNDPDSGYVFPGMPDNRGTVYLFGGLAQQRRGYMHRSTLSSTGYLKVYHYDHDLRFWETHIFEARENAAEPAAVSLTAMPDDVHVETVTVHNDYIPVRVDSAWLSPPFAVQVLTPDSAQWAQELVVRFRPEAEGLYLDTLRYHVDYYDRWYSVPVAGFAMVPIVDGVDGPGAVLPSAFALSAAPNPFNARTRLSMTVPRAGWVTLKLYDTLGREVATLWDGTLAAGTRTVAFDGAALSTGVYLARLATDEGGLTQKLLLLK